MSKTAKSWLGTRRRAGGRDESRTGTGYQKGERAHAAEKRDRGFGQSKEEKATKRKRTKPGGTRSKATARSGRQAQDKRTQVEPIAQGPMDARWAGMKMLIRTASVRRGREGRS